MQTKIIDGKKMAADVRAGLKKQVATFPRAPKLAVILVGDNPASQIYVRRKMQAAEEVGIKVDLFNLSPVLTQEALIAFIEDLNKDDNVDGIIVQLPLPAHLDSYRVVETIHPDKDVDGLCHSNLGKLFTGRPGLVPCTPLACLALIQSVCPKLDGKRVVVVGRSCLVGKPVGQLLLENQCTVTQAHSHTKNLKEVCREADILVVAAGHPRLIGKEYVKKGAIVIDVGINRESSGKICGDVDFEGVSGVVKAITPVPGGVGPMTVAMLLSNVVKVYVQKKLGKNA